LTLWDINQRRESGGWILAYRLTDSGHVIFQGEDFGSSPLDATDSDATIAGLLGFLTLQPGDTDAEYFATYTTEQMEWAGSQSAELCRDWMMQTEESRQA